MAAGRRAGNRDLERIVGLVRRHAPDIVALQEIDARRKTGLDRTGLRISEGRAWNARRRSARDHRAGRRLWPCHDQPLADAGHDSARCFARGQRAARGDRDDCRNAVWAAACRGRASRPEFQRATPSGRTACEAADSRDRRARWSSAISTTGSGEAPCSARSPNAWPSARIKRPFPHGCRSSRWTASIAARPRFSCEAGPIPTRGALRPPSGHRRAGASAGALRSARPRLPPSPAPRACGRSGRGSSS